MGGSDRGLGQRLGLGLGLELEAASMGLGPALAERLWCPVAGRGADVAAPAGPSGSLLRPLAEVSEAAGAAPARARLLGLAALCACAGAPPERRNRGL